VEISFQKVKGSLFNFGFRSLGILAKFILIIYISKSMSFETLGLYNIISVTVAWSVYVIGFEFYSYSLRHIVGEKNEVISVHVYNQLIFHLAAYILLFLASPVLVVMDFIPLTLIPYFILITIFDQLSQECYRICVAMERSQFANFIHFIKSGLWIYPLLILPVLGRDVTIHVIFAAWLAGTIAAFVLGMTKLASLGVLRFRRLPVNKAWIRKGVFVAFPFLIISFAQLTMDFADRYLIDFFLGKEKVGIYSFFYGISNVPTTLITSVLVAQYYPRVINAYKFSVARDERRKTIRAFLYQCIGFAVGLSLLILLLLPYLLEFIGKSQLTENIGLLYLMLLQVIVFAVQVVVQTVLYARLQDKGLLYSAIGGAVLNVVLNVILIPLLGLYGAVGSTIISMLAMLLIRVFLLRNPNNNRIENYGSV
jgi:O-antigen/teichoic acid export membrane protein